MVKKIYQNPENTAFNDLLTFSKFTFQRYYKHNSKPEPESYIINMHVDPDAFVKGYSLMKDISRMILQDFRRVSNYVFGELTILPDYDKFTLVDAVIQPIYTDWEEINRNQEKLLEQLKRGGEQLDFQNIGNTARTILQKLSDIVYDPLVHKPSDPKVDVSSGKFKNRLHSYIDAELKGSDNTELRQFAEAQITAMEKTIDLANTTTHKLDAKWTFAEACVVGTISVISVIKVIHKGKGN